MVNLTIDQGQIPVCHGQGHFFNFLTIDYGVNSRVSWSWSVPPKLELVAEFCFKLQLKSNTHDLLNLAL